MVVVRGGASGLAQEVVVDQQHRLVADEPESAGGANAGPSPYDFLLIALGT